MRVPSAHHYQLHDFKFDDIHMDDEDTLKVRAVKFKLGCDFNRSFLWLNIVLPLLRTICTYRSALEKVLVSISKFRCM